MPPQLPGVQGRRRARGGGLLPGVLHGAQGLPAPGSAGQRDLKVTLLLELLEQRAGQGALEFKPREGAVTYQDPCRLGRQAGCLEPPRQLLERIPGLELKEMASHGLGSLCCGNNAFINCDSYSKRHQVERLKEARATGAGLLVTACPKCMIHLTCAMQDPHQDGPLEMKVRDLASLLAEQLR